MATSMSTQSWNDAASTAPLPKVSHAHLMADDAGSCSSSAETRARSARSGASVSAGGHVAHSESPTSATYGPVSSKSM